LLLLQEIISVVLTITAVILEIARRGGWKTARNSGDKEEAARMSECQLHATLFILKSAKML
jgi:hypothetical protein